MLLNLKGNGTFLSGLTRFFNMLTILNATNQHGFLLKEKECQAPDTTIIDKAYTLQQILLPALQLYVFLKKVIGGRGLILLNNCLQPLENLQIKETS